MKKIPLTRGMFALVDDADFEKFGQLNWCAQPVGKGRFYASRRKKGVLVLLHREIMGAKSGEILDHVNGDTQDNRRENLRFVSASQNGYNRRKGLRPMSSKFKGVCYVPQLNKTNPWLAYIGAAKGKTKRKYLGYHGEEVSAARAYDTAAIETFGEHARLNFSL